MKISPPSKAFHASKALSLLQINHSILHQEIHIMRGSTCASSSLEFMCEKPMKNKAPPPVESSRDKLLWPFWVLPVPCDLVRFNSAWAGLFSFVLVGLKHTPFIYKWKGETEDSLAVRWHVMRLRQFKTSKRNMSTSLPMEDMNWR